MTEKILGYHVTGNTPITADDLKGLIPSLSSQSELNEFERENILQAHEWAFGPRVLKSEDPLTEPYIRQVHKKMFDATWRWAGTYRTRETNIGVRPYFIIEQTGQLLGNAKYWLENRTFPIDEIAVRFHHRLVFIHPFPNGNGRHTRMMADVIAVRNGREAFTWGATNLQEAGRARETYIAALKETDANPDNIGKLLEFARA